MNSQTSAWISAVSSVIQAGAVIFTLAFLWWSLRLLAKQTQLARQSTLELAKQTRISSWIAASARYSELNDWALRDESILGMLGGATKASIYAAHVFNTFSLLYRMHEAGAIDADEWGADVRTLILAFQQDAFLRQNWNSDTKQQYSAAFCRFVDNEILPNAAKQAATGNESSVPPAP